MTKSLRAPFVLPNWSLSTLPTGAVKDIVNQLGHAIAQGEISPGERLPLENDLCTQFGVSRTVIREAIKVLSGKGMILTARRYGSRIRQFEEWHLLDPDVIRWHEPESPMAGRIYAASTELRLIIEPQAAALAAKRATDEERSLIMNAATHITVHPFGEEAMLAADYAFHSTILRASGNVMLSQLQGLILEILRFAAPTGKKAAPEIKVTRDPHVKVAEAILNGDAESARNGMFGMLQQNQVVAFKLVSLG